MTTILVIEFNVIQSARAICIVRRELVRVWITFNSLPAPTIDSYEVGPRSVDHQ